MIKKIAAAPNSNTKPSRNRNSSPELSTGEFSDLFDFDFIFATAEVLLLFNCSYCKGLN